MQYAIYPEKQGTPTGTTEDGSYPWSNLVNDKSRIKVGKAGAGEQTVTLRCPISANAQVLSLHGTNAETAICTITLDSAEQALDAEAAVDAGGGLVTIPLTGHGYSEGETILINGTTNYDGVHVLPVQTAGGVDDIVITATYVAETFAGTETACIIVETETHTLERSDETLDRFWQTYTEQTGSHHATIKLTAASGETAEAGIFRAGGLLTMGGPSYGMSRPPKSFAVREPLRNGASYGKAGEIVRTFSYTTELIRETEWRDMNKLFHAVDPFPFAMLISSDMGDDDKYCVYGFFVNEPVPTDKSPEHCDVSVKIEEAV